MPNNVTQTLPLRPAGRLAKTVVLVGMMGAGKTSVGQAVARILGVPFLDSDEEIERAANRTIAEIFAREGEAFFRQKESQVIARLLSERPAILSTGGGAFLAEANRKTISEHGVSVWLDVDVETLWHRVRHKTTRPLLRTADPRATLGELHAARVPFYALADLTVRVPPDHTVDRTARDVIAALAGRPDILEMTE